MESTWGGRDNPSWRHEFGRRRMHIYGQNGDYVTDNKTLKLGCILLE
jgi:hypothetical protein